MTAPNPPEAILEPDLPIVDAHHHLWDGTPLVPTAGRYLFDEYLADVSSGHRIEASVYVEAQSMYRLAGPEELRSVGEVEFANGVAAMSASGRYGARRVCDGIVGYADLRLGDRVVPVLEALVAAGNGRLRGIRNLGAIDADRAIYQVERPFGLLRDPQFRAGYAQLARFGLSFDAWMHHTQLDDVVELAHAFPQTTLVLDHCGGPLRIGRYAANLVQADADWRRAIERVARCPNVVMKVGGMGMRFLGFPAPAADDRAFRESPSQWFAALWRPFIEPCVQLFGPERCMFESNFPVDRHACDYATLWNAFKRLASGYSAAEKAALFSGTARRVYRLSVGA